MANVMPIVTIIDFQKLFLTIDEGRAKAVVEKQQFIDFKIFS